MSTRGADAASCGASVSGRPSRAIRSRAVTRAPGCARSPLIVRRPSVIQPSISRREPSPWDASIFWTRCGSVALGILVGTGARCGGFHTLARGQVAAQIGHGRGRALVFGALLTRGIAATVRAGLAQSQLERDAELIQVAQLRERRQL